MLRGISDNDEPKHKGSLLIFDESPLVRHLHRLVEVPSTAVFCIRVRSFVSQVDPCLLDHLDRVFVLRSEKQDLHRVPNRLHLVGLPHVPEIIQKGVQHLFVVVSQNIGYVVRAWISAHEAFLDELEL